jgi:hypothetical protein
VLHLGHLIHDSLFAPVHPKESTTAAANARKIPSPFFIASLQSKGTIVTIDILILQGTNLPFTL